MWESYHEVQELSEVEEAESCAERASCLQQTEPVVGVVSTLL